jgi:DtxR family transcriptional regulator, Mn-dependent transcriptional regulator
MGVSPDPATALWIFAAIALLCAVVFWPERGIVARVRRSVALDDRVRLEDGLKHLLAHEGARRASSVESLAGAIGVSRGRTVEILRTLKGMDLVRLGEEDVFLTDEGRAYALRIVRTHRLWERYLADRTGVGAADWHTQAERLEHGLAPDEVERLAASMGHPLYDPHGDPIPTAGGELPPARGVPLSSLLPGSSARVVHIEDEPEEVYRSLSAAGIGRDSRLRLERIGSAGLDLRVEGRLVTIEPLAARNLSVERVEAEGPEEGLERLCALHPGEEGVVVRVGGRVQGAQRRRLLDLGVVPGTVIRAELASISGDPVAYRIRGAVIALRRAQADDIVIRRRREEAA